jgi:hypothetical protein
MKIKHNSLNPLMALLSGRTLLIATLLLLLSSASGALGIAQAQSACVTAATEPAPAYPLFDWRLINDGELPQSYGYAMKEDLVQIDVEDGARLSLATNQMFVVLKSQVNSPKEIAAWGYSKGWTQSVSTSGVNAGPTAMMLFKAPCDGADTIVFRKAKTFGIMTSMYQLDIPSFWRLLGGKIVTITWINDTQGNPQYPPTCTGACVPLGTLVEPTPAVKLTGDFNGDGRTDIALTGPSVWNTLPVAFSNGNGSFTVTNTFIGDFAAWAAHPRAKKLTGDFNGDGRTDIALTGPSGWNTLPLALSNANGSFTVTNIYIGNFASWATNLQVAVLTGDYNGDGRTDIALLGPAGWSTLPVAFSNGNGSFSVTNLPITDFAGWASDPQAKKLTGDFNGDGRTDIALTGPAGWNTLPVAFSLGNGSFTVTNLPSADFAGWASDPQAKKLTGDFNGDGRTDIALTGSSHWETLPVAFSNGNGSFFVTNILIAHFAGWSSDPQAKKLVGDFNGDGKVDIALTGPSSWNTLPLAFSNGNGSFTVTNIFIGDFARWSSDPWAKRLLGDFNGDGKADVALTCPSVWNALPVALSNTNGSFTVSNRFIEDFATWAAPSSGTGFH